MSELREVELPDAERDARDAVRALGSPRPDAAYRQRIARAFVSGSLRPAVRQRTLWERNRVWLVTAAAAGLAVVAMALNRGPEWQIIGTGGHGTATVDGRPLALESAYLPFAIRRGAHIVLSADASLDLVAPGVLAVNLDGGTDVVLPAAPNRWWLRSARGRLNVGDAFITTGHAFHGAKLSMATAEAEAHVTGTSLAVLRDREAGTCVCVMEGRVNVAYGDESVPVPAGQRCVCPPGGEAKLAPILMFSEHALHRLNARSAALLQR